MRIPDAPTRWAELPLIEPPPAGFLHVAAAVDPPAGPPIERRSARRTAVLTQLKAIARELEALDAVTRAGVYRAVLVPPVGDARFDVAVLVETRSVADLDAVRASEPGRRLLEAAGAAARDVHVMAARCIRRIADVDRTRPGLFLFNHFAAPDAEAALPVWDRLAAWYVAETGLDNSTLLAPVGGAGRFAFVNHARWDDSLPGLAWRQFSRRSFRTYVRATLRATGVQAMPVLYRLA
jgi:hypothetical protein